MQTRRLAHTVSAFVGLLLHACTPNAVTSIHGQVMDDMQQPIANVTIQALPGNTITTSAADGTFTLSPGSTGWEGKTSISVRAEAFGYGIAYRAVDLRAASTVVHMKNAGVTTLTLGGNPNGTQKSWVPVSRIATPTAPTAPTMPVITMPNITFPPMPGLPNLDPSELFAGLSFNTGIGALNILIPEDGLALPSGAAVVGDIETSISIWLPNDPITDAPAPLVAEGDLALESYGMVTAQLQQDGQPLSLTAGNFVVAQVPVDASIAALLDNGEPMPNLYDVNPADGLWQQQGTVGNGMAYDPTTKTFTAELGTVAQPWNVDGGLKTSNGGCVTGRAINACNPFTTVNNFDVTLWFLSFEQVRNFPSQTDSAGNYCVSTPLTSMWPGSSANAQDANYFVAGTADITNTNMCDPAPSECTSCNPATEAYPEVSRSCTGCTLQTPTHKWPGNPERYDDTCNPGTPDVIIEPCHYCPGDPNMPAQCRGPEGVQAPVVGQCSQLQDVVVKGPGCTCKGPQESCNPGDVCCGVGAGQAMGCGPTNHCATCTVMGAGTPCVTGQDTCCSTDGSTLTCLDDVCVPTQDP